MKGTWPASRIRDPGRGSTVLLSACSRWNPQREAADVEGDCPLARPLPLGEPSAFL